MAKKILFWPDVYLEQGHWLPTVVWANGLKQSGDYIIEYMGIRDCAAVVKPFGYVESPTGSDKGKYHVIFEDLYPLGYTRMCQSSINERWKPDHIFAIAAGALNSIFQSASKPDLLVSGYFTSLESLLIHYLYDVKIVTTTTYLRHPQDDPAMRAIQNLMGFPRPVARKLMKSVLKDKWNDSMEIEDFVKPLELVNELIPCPREFEFNHYQHGDLVHFVEPCITPYEGGSSSDFWSKIPGDKKLIFATAGSQVQDYEKKAEHLFGQLIDMMNNPQMDGYHLIIGAGPKLSKKSWGTSSLYTVANWVPQREILENGRTSLAFIHGGLATIKECVYYNVPFVILPLGKDQMDNGLRLRQNGIAPIAYAERADSNSLLLSANKVIHDSWMAAKRKKMSDVFKQQENTVKPGLQVLLRGLSANGTI